MAEGKIIGFIIRLFDEIREAKNTTYKGTEALNDENKILKRQAKPKY